MGQGAERGPKQGGGARLAALLAALVCVPTLALALPRSPAVAVVGAPGRGSAEMAALVARAGGLILRPGGLPNVIVAVSPEPGFASRLYAEGAWLVLDPLVADGCFNLVSRADR